MYYYTFTTWQQVEDWIRNNGLVRWAFACERDKEGKLSRYVANSEWYPGDFEEQLATTRKALAQQPGRYLYGSGFHTDNKTLGEASCEVQLDAVGAGVSGLQQAQAQPIGEAQMRQWREDTRRELMAELERKEYEKERKAFEEERKEFEKYKQSAIGLAIDYLKPVIAAAMKRTGLANVAGTKDATQPIIAEPITPKKIQEQAEPETQEPEEDSPFTDEEAEQLMSLMVRFKAVEPDYLKLIEAVVKMAESGDATYSMAKGVLLK